MHLVRLKATLAQKRETNKRRNVCMQGKDRWTMGEAEKTDKDRQTNSLSFVHLFPLCPAAQHPCCLLFFLMRLAKRGDTSPLDYSAYSCCDALFNMPLADLLDWHPSREHFTIALYS